MNFAFACLLFHDFMCDNITKKVLGGNLLDFRLLSATFDLQMGVLNE